MRYTTTAAMILGLFALSTPLAWSQPRGEDAHFDPPTRAFADPAAAYERVVDAAIKAAMSRGIGDSNISRFPLFG